MVEWWPERLEIHRMKSGRPLIRVLVTIACSVAVAIGVDDCYRSGNIVPNTISGRWGYFDAVGLLARAIEQFEREYGRAPLSVSEVVASQPDFFTPGWSKYRTGEIIRRAVILRDVRVRDHGVREPVKRWLLAVRVPRSYPVLEDYAYVAASDGPLGPQPLDRIDALLGPGVADAIRAADERPLRE
jgi:hypothetical protein